jgi:tRNA pseudouridine55 synthase
LTGDIRQVPSSVSAIKVDGRRAYARVRAGETVELADRPVTVSRFVVHDVRPAPRVPEDLVDDLPAAVDVDVTVVCSSGTYIRALARDLGAGLGVGGHLTALRRSRVGGYGLDVARTLDELATTPDDVPLGVLSLADAARATFAVRDLTDAEARSLSFGHRIPLTPGTPAGTVAAIAPDGALVALLQTAGPQLRPVVVFAPA